MKIDQRDEKIRRLEEEVERLKLIAYSGKGSMSYTIHSPARFADEDAKQKAKKK